MSEPALTPLAQGKAAQRTSVALLFFTPLSLVVYPGLGSTWTGLIFLWGLILWALPGPRPTLDRQERWFLWSSFGLFAVAALSLTVALDLDEGVSDLGRYAHFLLLIPLYLGLRRQHLGTLTPVAWGGALACLVFAGWAWYQVGEYGWSWRRASGFYNAIPFAQYAALSLCLSFGLLSRRAWWPVFLLAFMAGVYAVIQSHTRGVWLSLILVPFCLAWFGSGLKGRFVALLLAVMGLLVLVFGVLAEWPVFDAISKGVNSLKSHFDGDDRCRSWSMRLEMWRYVFLFWQSHPLLGSGLGGYAPAVSWLMESGVVHNPCPLTLKHHAHSNLFQTLITMGILGFLAFINWFLSAALMLMRRNPGLPASLGLVVVMMLFFFGLTESWLAKSLSVKYFLVVMVALMAAQGPGKNASTQ